MTCTDLTDTCHPGDEQLAKEFVLHWHLSEEVVDFIILTIYSVSLFSPDHVGKNKTGLCKESREGRERKVVVKRRLGQMIQKMLSLIYLFIWLGNSTPETDVTQSAREKMCHSVRTTETLSPPAVLWWCALYCLNSPLSHDVEYSVLSRDWDAEYLEIIGSLPKKL